METKFLSNVSRFFKTCFYPQTSKLNPIVPELKEPLAESRVREIMAPVCEKNAYNRTHGTYRAYKPGLGEGNWVIQDERGIEEGQHGCALDLSREKENWRACAGVDLGHPVFSPQEAEAAFCQIFGAQEFELQLYDFYYLENVILQQYSCGRYGYVIKIYGFYAIIYIGDYYCYICEDFSVYHDCISVGRDKCITVPLKQKKAMQHWGTDYSTIKAEVGFKFSLQDYTVKAMELNASGSYGYYAGGWSELKERKDYACPPTQREFEADMREFSGKLDGVLRKRMSELKWDWHSHIETGVTLYKRKPDILIGKLPERTERIISFSIK